MPIPFTELRDLANITRADLAHATDIDELEVEAIEHGALEPSPSWCHRAATYLAEALHT